MSVANILSMAGGLGLFLFGIRTMGDGLENAAGAKLKRMLEVLTGNRFLAVLVGFVVTAIIQSSTATTVMVVGFVNAGMMSLAQAVGVIMGAELFERRGGSSARRRYTHARVEKDRCQEPRRNIHGLRSALSRHRYDVRFHGSAQRERRLHELYRHRLGVASAPAVRYYSRHSHDRRAPELFGVRRRAPDSRHAGTCSAQVFRFRPLRSEYRNLPHGALLDRRREEFKACRSYPPALQCYRHGHIYSYRPAHSLCRVDREAVARPDGADSHIAYSF